MAPSVILHVRGAAGRRVTEGSRGNTVWTKGHRGESLQRTGPVPWNLGTWAMGSELAPEEPAPSLVF